MEIQTVFKAASTVAMVGWVILMACPRTKVSRVAVRSGALSAFFGIVYAALFLLGNGVRDGFQFSDFQTLEGVFHLFQNPYFLTAGWIHYLAFDLLVGVWMVGDAEKRNIRHLFIVPSLLLTFMFGPVGFVTYLGLRKGLRK